MESFFAPALHLMNRLRFRGKLLALLCVFAVSGGSLLAKLSINHLDSIRDTRLEQRGAALLPAIYNLLDNVQQHRGLTNGALAGDAAMKEKLPARRAEVDAALQSIRTGISPELAIDADLAAIQQDWARIVSTPTGGPESFVEHNALIARILGLFARLGDSSKLILDPSLEGYHLANVTVDHVPALAEHLARLRGIGARALADGALSPDEELQLLALLANSAEIQARLEQSREAFRSTVPQYGARFEADIAELARTRGAVAEAVTAARAGRAMPAGEFFVLASAPIKVAFGLAEGARNALTGATSARLKDEWIRLAIDVAIAGVGTLVVLYLMFGLHLSIRHSMAALARGAKAFSQGDFSARIETTTRDEIAEATQQFNAMAGEIGALVAEVQHGVVTLNAAIHRLTQASSGVAAGSRQQSDAAQSTAGAVEEMASSIACVADRVEESLGLSQRASQLSKDGEDIARAAADEIAQMAVAVRESSARVGRLSEHSVRVSGIVKVIRDVADQTNLLALNAAIEAARAGELGRGFAVVADEVRKLAERTATATTEIAEVISVIEQGTLASVDSIQDAGKRVDRGVAQAERAAASLAEIHAGTQVTLERVSEIAAAAREQRSASQEIGRHVESIAAMAEQNDNAVQDIDATANELGSAAASLGELMRRFRVAA